MRVNQAQALFQTLKHISIKEVRRTLDKKRADPAVGITIAKMSLKPIKFEGLVYHIYAARVMPRTIGGKQPFVTPHMHKRGCEPYYFLGKGEMNLGHLTPHGKSCLWKKPVLVKAGDQVLIRENEIHSFRNIGKGNSDFLFACPKYHLIDFSEQNPDGDRYIIKKLKNSIPQHYSK